MADILHFTLIGAFAAVVLGLTILNVVMTTLLLTRHRDLAVSVANRVWPYVKYFRLGGNSEADFRRSKRA
jgi:hypothetical protein